jgi:phage anti-repressor protein
LGVKEKFADWIKRRIAERQLLENVDYLSSSENSEKPSAGRPTKEYWLTIDAAKHISMMHEKLGNEGQFAD